MLFRGRRSGDARGGATYQKSMLNCYRTLNRGCETKMHKKQEAKATDSTWMWGCTNDLHWANPCSSYSWMSTDRWGEEITTRIHDVCGRHCRGTLWRQRSKLNMTEYLDTWKQLLEEKVGWGLAGWKFSLWISLSGRMNQEIESPWR